MVLSLKRQAIWLRCVLLTALLIPVWTAGARSYAQSQKPRRLHGTVYRRGSIVRIQGAEVWAELGGAKHRVGTDARGEFELALPPEAFTQRVSIIVHIKEPLYETLHQETVVQPGTQPEIIQAEYVMRPLPAYRQPFSTVVRGNAPNEGEHISLRGEELHTLPGTLGDPFRVIGLLPGVTTPIPLLPVFVVRGASPGMSGFFLDGMRVPELFHVLVGGGVIHARLVETLDFYPGAYDASFGRFAGGIIDARTRPARSDGYHGELELRLFDLGGLVELALPHEVRLTMSGHYGYPGPIVHAIDNRVGVSYWDYQLRLDWKGLTLQALGSFDEVNIDAALLSGRLSTEAPAVQTFRLSFHRVQLRHAVHLGRMELETAAVGGIDQMTAFQGTGVNKLSLSLRAVAAWRWPALKLRLGIDTELSRFEGQDFDKDPMRARPDDLGELAGSRDGVVGSGFVVASVGPLAAVTATLSARLDVYRASNVTLFGADPRMQLRAQLTDWLTLHAGFGFYQQPPTFPVALPGIDTFALRLGLQRAMHGAVGEELKLPASLTFSATGFYQRYYNSNDVVFDFAPSRCTSPPPESLSGYIAQVMRQVDGMSYGVEVMLRRASQGNRVSGWIAYTLGRAERAFSCGLRPADYDQTHVVNAVLQVRLPWNLMAGARLYYSTGLPATQLIPPDGHSTLRNNMRLHDNVQLDLRLDREWVFRRFAIAAFIEVVNATYGQAVFGVTYPRKDNIPRYDDPQPNGFPWILPSIGVRGRF